METKICRICLQEKLITDFYINKKNPRIVYRTECKECYNRKKRSRAPRNAEIQRNHCKTEKYKETIKRYYAKEDVRLKRLEASRKWREKNKDRIKKYKCNPETLKRWKEKNKDILKEKSRNRDNFKYKNDPLFRLHKCFSSLVRWNLVRVKVGKSKKVENLLGYTIQDLKIYLESKFEDWMTWDNYGKTASELKQTWQIDHIRPVNTFNITSEDCEDFKKCWALENLRPLDSYINVRRPRDGNDEI